MEAMAYTWFNRFAAIRYMELHGYLEHGYRVLSHPEDREQPEILDHAADVNLPGLDQEKVVELMLEGSSATKRSISFCSRLPSATRLHQAMPFLFERIGDATELLLPVPTCYTPTHSFGVWSGALTKALGTRLRLSAGCTSSISRRRKSRVIGKVVEI